MPADWQSWVNVTWISLYKNNITGKGIPLAETFPAPYTSSKGLPLRKCMYNMQRTIELGFKYAGRDVWDNLAHFYGRLPAGTLPSEWAAMRKLQFLSLTNNTITGAPHALLMAVSKLMTFSRCLSIRLNKQKDVPKEAADALTAES